MTVAYDGSMTSTLCEPQTAAGQFGVVELSDAPTAPNAVLVRWRPGRCLLLHFYLRGHRC